MSVTCQNWLSVFHRTSGKRSCGYWPIFKFAVFTCKVRTCTCQVRNVLKRLRQLFFFFFFFKSEVCVVLWEMLITSYAYLSNGCFVFCFVVVVVLCEDYSSLVGQWLLWFFLHFPPRCFETLMLPSTGVTGKDHSDRLKGTPSEEAFAVFVCFLLLFVCLF